MEEETMQEQQEMVDISLEEEQEPETREEEPGGGEEHREEQGGEEAPREEPEQRERTAEEEEAARRHYFAAQRRQQEEAQRRAAHEAEIDAIYASAFKDQLNPYTGRPIRSRKDYEEYQRAYREDEERQQRQRMQESGVDPAALEGMIAKAVRENPVVQQANNVVAQAQRMEQQARKTQRDALISSGLQEIAAVDPRVKNAEDLKTLYGEHWDEMLGYIRAGVPMAKAWRAANMDTLMQQGRDAGRQAALNAMGSKSHMRSMQSQGKTTVSMPKEVLEQYRQIVPGHSDAEYARHWAKNHKK